jgi:adenylate cyclase
LICSILPQKIQKLSKFFLIAPSVTLIAIAGSYLGLFQSLELSCLDRWFRFRSQKSLEPEIIVVTIDESDISNLGHWPISDRVLAQLITQIKQQQPSIIGLDLYRDLPVAPGQGQLQQVLESTSNIIGVEKAVGEIIKPSPILKKQDQIAIADLVLDEDGKIRRGLLSIRANDGEIKLGLAAKLALSYLAEKGINLQTIENTENLSLGKAVIVPFQSNDGGYVGADAGGFQILLNYHGDQKSFKYVSLSEVLNQEISPDLMRDRIVLIGSTAPSLNDLFLTPLSQDSGNSPQYLPGVFIHANIISSILDAALDERPLIRVFPEPLEWLWILTWSVVGTSVSWLLSKNKFQLERVWLYLNYGFILVVFPGVTLFASSYLMFLKGWWLISTTPYVAYMLASLTSLVYLNQSQQKLAFIDSLTQAANRRYFDQYLQQQWQKCIIKKSPVALILCDVDFFKKYNDTYGHQAGDRCLQQVAVAMNQAVRDRDLVARYGGEEFVIVLSNTNAQEAIVVAQKICKQVSSLEIPHCNSEANQFVTLSCGVTSTIPNILSSPEQLIATADRALYDAKKQGRDRAVLIDDL